MHKLSQPKVVYLSVLTSQVISLRAAVMRLVAVGANRGTAKGDADLPIHLLNHNLRIVLVGLDVKQRGVAAEWICCCILLMMRMWTREAEGSHKINEIEG